MSFGTRLEIFRTSKGWTQLQIASAIGVSLRTYSRYVSGGGAPNVAHLERLAEHGADVSWLLTGSTAKTSRAEVDDELMGRVTDAIVRLYRDERVSLAPVDLGRLAAQRYSEIVAATDEPAERYAMIKLVVQQLRQDLHIKAADPSTSKRLA